MDFFAYLDAGTGSLIVQTVVGALVGIGVILKTFWGRIIGVFKKSDAVTDKKETKQSNTSATKVGKASK
jgi:hypothetical protein